MCITEVAYEVSDQWKGILIAYGDGIDLLIVLHQSHVAVLFMNEEK